EPAPLERQRERKRRTVADPARHPDPAAEVLDDAAADMQTEAGAPRPAAHCATPLAELVEDDLLVLRADAGAIVAHVDPQVAAVFSDANEHLPLALLAEFD